MPTRAKHLIIRWIISAQPRYIVVLVRVNARANTAHPKRQRCPTTAQRVVRTFPVAQQANYGPWAASCLPSARRRTGNWEVAAPTLPAIAPATVTNRSSQAGQPMSTQTAPPQLSEVSTMVDFMIIPSFAAVASQQASRRCNHPRRRPRLCQPAHTTIASDAYHRSGAVRRQHRWTTEPFSTAGVPAPPPNVVQTQWRMPVAHS
jgi:hypothetical protein